LGAEFIVTLETVHATVEAFAAGRITLPSPKQKHPKDVRFAPSLCLERMFANAMAFLILLKRSRDSNDLSDEIKRRAAVTSCGPQLRS
jgi:hypothetical protein